MLHERFPSPTPATLREIVNAPLERRQTSNGRLLQPLLPPLEYPYPSPSEPTYTTLWKGRVTLGELLLDTQVRKVAFAKMRSLGYVDEDAQDCFQLGTINLWKTLQKQPDLLVDKGAAWVGIWIAYSGSRRSLWKHKARCTSLDEVKHDWKMDDERTELYQRGRPERWASWATRVDQRIDFTLLMNALAQQYADDPIKLFALYSLTTSVKMKDILSVVNADKNQLIHARNQVKEDIRQRLEMDNDRDVTEEFCVEQFQNGQHLECVTRVAEQVEDDLRLLLALYIVTTSATRRDVTALFGIKLTAFRKEIKRIKALLQEQFRCNGRIV